MSVVPYDPKRGAAAVGPPPFDAFTAMVGLPVYHEPPPLRRSSMTPTLTRADSGARGGGGTLLAALRADGAAFAREMMALPPGLQRGSPAIAAARADGEAFARQLAWQEREVDYDFVTGRMPELSIGAPATRRHPAQSPLLSAVPPQRSTVHVKPPASQRRPFEAAVHHPASRAPSIVFNTDRRVLFTAAEIDRIKHDAEMVEHVRLSPPGVKPTRANSNAWLTRAAAVPQPPATFRYGLVGISKLTGPTGKSESHIKIDAYAHVADGVRLTLGRIGVTTDETITTITHFDAYAKTSPDLTVILDTLGVPTAGLITCVLRALLAAIVREFGDTGVVYEPTGGGVAKELPIALQRLGMDKDDDVPIRSARDMSTAAVPSAFTITAPLNLDPVTAAVEYPIEYTA
jgi:hypothetical protein